LDLVVDLIVKHSSDYVKNSEKNSELFLKFIKNSAGALMMLSVDKTTKEKMKKLNVSEILEGLKDDVQEIQDDTTVSTILSKISNNLFEK
jgi:predicted glycosyltransferase involved in capsule biosynthesis